MHELGIVFRIADTLKEIGEENCLKEIASVTLEIGEVSGVVESYLQNCWKWTAEKSDLLKGAKLIVEHIPAVTYCEDCEKTYGTVKHGKICPYCDSPHTYLVTGNEFNIKEIAGC